MTCTIAFDVYGTLIDTNGVIKSLKKLIGEKAGKFSDTWRNKQLEYSFRRGLMRDYVRFSVCTEQALEYTCEKYQAGLTFEEKNALLDMYNSLPAFDDAKVCLPELIQTGHRLYALSNGDFESVNLALESAGLRKYFIDIVSVDDLKTFKPNPGVYHYFLEKSGAGPENAWLISGNPFDVTGALHAGMKAAWVKRSSHIIFDPWEHTPSVTVDTLHNLGKHLN